MKSKLTTQEKCERAWGIFMSSVKCDAIILLNELEHLKPEMLKEIKNNEN